MALRNIWNEIRSGENLDVYLLIFATLGIFVLQLLQVDIGPIFPLVTLAALSVLAHSASEVGTLYRS